MKAGKQPSARQTSREKPFQPVAMPARLKISLALACAFAGIALYINTLHHGYLLDDAGAVTGNVYVQQGVKGIPGILRTGMWHFEPPLSAPAEASETDTTGTDPAAFFQLGYQYASAGDYRRAIPYFERAVSLNPSDIGSYINLANCYGLLEQYDKTIILLNRVLAINPDDGQALGNLAVTYEKMGDYERAMEYTKRLKAVTGEKKQ
jgi:tetratricopeptide (TPR) repeat protein